MTTRHAKKPAPRPDQESRWYWEACARRELYVQRCGNCGALRSYPRALCPECLSSATDYLRASGRGTVYTFTVTYQNQAPGFREELPYVLAWIELEEGPRVLSNVVGCPPEKVAIGMPVVVDFEEFGDSGEKLALPVFKREEPSA
ncbi:MAG: Zn-ribbon domain-containing OB-fold protein [Candidatus Binatia bacterium]